MTDNGAAKPHGRADLMRDLQAGEVRCTARSKRTGERCKRASSLGSNVCRAHGSASPQARAKAQRRLSQAADVLVQRLLSMALDGNVDDPTALRAVRDALDRAGLSAKTSVEVEVSNRPIDQIFTQLDFGGSRAEWRRSQGIENADDEQPPALAELTAGRHDDPIDVETVDVIDPVHPMTPGADERPPVEPTAPGIGLSREAIEQAMTVVEANEVVAQLRHNAVIHPVRRALPPGHGGR